jgi:hypothetical protein
MPHVRFACCRCPSPRVAATQEAVPGLIHLGGFTTFRDASVGLNSGSSRAVNMASGNGAGFATRQGPYCFHG